MHDLLYLYQGYWNQMTEDEFVDWVQEVAEGWELDVDQFTKDLLNPEKEPGLNSSPKSGLPLA